MGTIGSSDERERAHGRLLTRAQVARRLGVALTTVRRMEGDVLHPRMAEDGRWLFDREEVERTAVGRPKATSAPGTSGEIAAGVFWMFRQGYSLDEIVMRMKQPPGAVRALFAEWCRGL